MNGPGVRQQVIEKVATKLRFPQAAAIFLALFLLDLFIPDLVPFADEILLGLAATLFGMWREPTAPAAPAATASRATPMNPKPPEKNVTPGS